MVLVVAACALILAVSWTAGNGLLAVARAKDLRAGDQFILAAWVGLVVVAVALLAVSLVVPLSPAAGAITGAAIAVFGVGLSRRASRSVSPAATDVPLGRTAAVAGLALIAIGASALASDPVTLYDSLVYHVGIIRWLREHGTPVGIALLHNRLGHMSSWFAIAAPFDSSIAQFRAFNVGLSVALVLVGAQGAIAAARIAARRATEADWFLLLASAALLWPVARYDAAASPSPDVVTNALIIVVAWAMLVVAPPLATNDRQPVLPRSARLIPLVLAVGALTMKLFALPAAVAAAMLYVFARDDDASVRAISRRAGVAAGVGALLLFPLIVANLAASGCPLFPSPIGCLDTPFSVGRADAAEYAEYVRNVARWQSRRSFVELADLPWAGGWISAHPLLSTLAATASVLAVVVVRPSRHDDGVRWALFCALFGIAFAMWQAPAPRFLYAFIVITPALAIARPLAAWSERAATSRDDVPLGIDVRRASALGFVAFSFVAGSVYALASQKLNVLSALQTGGSAISIAPAELLLPAAPELPPRLYRLRINDIDLVTAVPRPIVDTLSYRSTIDGDLGFEKCSTAPLPCTPYLPSGDLHLRSPTRGLGGGFERRSAPRARDARD